jgi:nucleotide-binding universal stress UspA family protein
MRKILIAIDGSEGASKAADYAGKQFAGISDLQITLYHVSPGVPPELWDDGHILDEEEKTARRKVLDKWLANQQAKIESIFQPAIEGLTQRGINPKQIETKSVSESVKNTAECILAKAKTGGYQTLIMGRCGAPATVHALMGSIANKIASRGAGIAVCLVG